MNVKLKRKMTLKQKKFCHYYLISGNETKAAIKAGYSKRTAAQVGNENLKKPNVKHYLHSQEKRVSTDSILTAQQAYELLTKIALAKVTEDVNLTSTLDGYIKDKKRPDISDRISAIKELLKRPLLKSQIVKNNQSTKKDRAETDIKRYEAKQDDSAQNKTINQTTKILQKLADAAKK